MAFSVDSSRTYLLVGGVAALCVALIGVGVYFAIKNPDSGIDNSVLTNRLSHDTLRSEEPTWKPNYDQLGSAISILKLPSASPTLLHHHVHLDVVIDGQPVEVPAQIGLGPDAESPQHTHDATGILHVESSDTAFQPTLGQFFDVWGVYLSSTGIGGYVNKNDQTVAAYVNGTLYQGDPNAISILPDHEEIYLTYGTPAELPTTIPATYTFPTNL